MREWLGKHSCMSSQFPKAILNGTSFFLSLVQEKLNMPSGGIKFQANNLIRIKGIVPEMAI